MSILPRYARSSVTRYMLAKLAEGQRDDPAKRASWYKIDTFELPSQLRQKFYQSCMDEETEQFLALCVEKSGWVFTQFFHSIVQVFLGFMVSMTTINGFLDRGKMFVFSNDQFKNLLDIDDSCSNRTLLDLGAGDGTVTQRMADHFKRVYVTESSSTMRRRLSQKGFTVLDIDEWQKSQYDVISILNLVDRIGNPLQLLNDVRLSLNRGGMVILAIVLPYSPVVEQGSKFVPPEEKLRISGRSVEEQIRTFVMDVLEPAGFEVQKFTKLPYLCEGDLYDDYFLLYDYVFVLKSRILSD